MIGSKRTMAAGRRASNWRWRWAPSGLLAIAIALAGLPGVTWAADEPDLKLEKVRLFANAGGQVNEQVVSFKVTNVGNRDAPEGTGKLEIVSPAPAKEEALKIPKLAKNGGSFEGVAQLGAPCDGHVVRVAVSAPGETSFADNKIGPLKLCPDKPAPAGGGVLRPPVELEAAPLSEALDLRPPLETEAVPLSEAVPEHLRLGVHSDSANDARWPAEMLETSVLHRHVVGRKDQFILDACIERPPFDPSIGDVGYLFEDYAGCDITFVRQLILNFDLQWLRGIEKKYVSRAELLFDEQVVDSRNDDGERITVETCVGRLGLAPPDWTVIVARRDAPGSLLPALLASTPVEGDRLTIGVGEPSRWDVTKDVRSATLGHNEPLTGLVLHGPDENLGAETQRTCMSNLSNVRLKLEYTVLPGN